jgi:hypothetical protein
MLLHRASGNALPLLSELPRDKPDTDTERKAKIEAMG